MNTATSLGGLSRVDFFLATCGLKICGAHAGGYLASYSGRSDALCGRGAGAADCKSLKKRPSEYFKRELFVDTMVFHDEANKREFFDRAERTLQELRQPLAPQ